MKKRNVWILNLICLLTVKGHLFASHLVDAVEEKTLNNIYEFYAGLSPQYCDIGEHMIHLKQLAVECPIVTEIGLGHVISTWGLLQGLSENRSKNRSYTGIDIRYPPADNLLLAKELAEKNGISFGFRLGNDLYLDIEPTDLLFIDSMHTYSHLMYELEKFSPVVSKYIAMHDTSEPWGDLDDAEYVGDYSEYPESIDRNKRGLWNAVVDFLANHPEWALVERYTNCHGFTILKRVK